MKTIEQSLLNRVLYIGNELPECFMTDSRSKCVFLGNPQQIIDETSPEKKKTNHEMACWIAEYAYKKANPDGKFNEPPSMVYEQVAKDFNKFLLS